MDGLEMIGCLVLAHPSSLEHEEEKGITPEIASSVKFHIFVKDEINNYTDGGPADEHWHEVFSLAEESDRIKEYVVHQYAA